MQIIITNMNWERIILNISGKISGYSDVDLQKYGFVLAGDKQLIPLKYFSINDDGTFLLRMDIFRANELFPLPNGIWKLYLSEMSLYNKKNAEMIPISVDMQACGFTKESFDPFEFGDSYYPEFKKTDKYKHRISKIFRYKRCEYRINIPEIKGNIKTLTFDIFYDGKGYLSDSQYDALKKKYADKKAALIEDSRLVWEKFRIDHPELFDNEEVPEDEEEVSVAKQAVIRAFKFVRKKINGFITKIKTHVYRAFFYIFSRVVKKDGKTILFTSDSRESLSGNMECIYNRLIERGLDKEYTIKQIFKASVRDRRKFKDKFRFTYDIVKADFIIVDDYHPLLYKVSFPKSTTIIQVWHASGAFKTVGFSRIGKPGGPSPFSNHHKNYTHALVSSDYDVPFYAEAFGIDESHVVPTGIPRMDFFFNEEYKKDVVERMHNEFPATVGKRVIMFAPTFRGSGPRVAFYDVEMIDYKGLAEYCKKTNSIIVFKMHPFVIEKLEIPAEYAEYFIDATDYREINDILFISDLVITDYSSLIFEYATLNRPMIFYAYDLDKYISKRDFYFEFRPFVPGKIVYSSDELLEALYNEDYELEKVEKFRHEHFKYFDDKSTDRVIDQLILKK